MTKTNVPVVRNLLAEHEDGLTKNEISKLTGISYGSVHSVVRRQRDIFIDHWRPNYESYRWEPVWCLMKPPENVPEPEMKVMEYLRTQERRAA